MKLKILNFTGQGLDAHRDLLVKTLVATMIVPLCLTFAVPVEADPSIQDELISIDVNKKKLVDVLDMVSEDTSYGFEIDEQWHDFPITVAFADLPLHEGLKRILNGLNNAIVYDSSDRIVKIFVYGNAETSRPSSGGISEGPIPRFPQSTTNPFIESMSENQSSISPESSETSLTEQENFESSHKQSQESENDTSEGEETTEDKSEENGEETDQDTEEASKKETEKDQ